MHFPLIKRYQKFIFHFMCNVYFLKNPKYHPLFVSKLNVHYLNPILRLSSLRLWYVWILDPKETKSVPVCPICAHCPQCTASGHQTKYWKWRTKAPAPNSTMSRYQTTLLVCTALFFGSEGSLTLALVSHGLLKS